MEEIRKALFKVRSYYMRKGFVKASVPTLLIGAMEEMGELAEAILLSEHVGDYRVASDKKTKADSIAHELGDVLTYLLAIGYKTSSIPIFQWEEEHDEWVSQFKGKPSIFAKEEGDGS